MDWEDEILKQAIELMTATALTLAVIAIYLLVHKWPWGHEQVEFVSVHDRPLLESVDAVIEARTHDTIAFRVGNEYYVVSNLPKEYIDYSSWAVRMP